MIFIKAVILISIGAFLLWIGAFMLITAMLPHDIAMKTAEEHGKWWRENVFHLPPITRKGDGECQIDKQ